MKTTKKKNLSPKAIRILRQAKIDILSHPENYDQWEPRVPNVHTCDSAGCIYGYIAMRHAVEIAPWDFLENEVNQFLGIEGFYTGKDRYALYDNWPREVARMLNNARTKREKALVAATAIELFIITDGFTDF